MGFSALMGFGARGPINHPSNLHRLPGTSTQPGTKARIITRTKVGISALYLRSFPPDIPFSCIKDASRARSSFWYAAYSSGFSLFQVSRISSTRSSPLCFATNPNGFLWGWGILLLLLSHIGLQRIQHDTELGACPLVSDADGQELVLFDDLMDRHRVS